MLTDTDTAYILNQLQVLQAHKEAMEQAIQRIMMVLSKNQAPLKTGVGQRVVAEREARLQKVKN